MRKHQCFSALKKLLALVLSSQAQTEILSAARAQFFQQSYALARAQLQKSAAQFCAHLQKIS